MKQTTRSRRTVVRHLADLTADPQNANRGTPRGRAALAHSLRDYGAGRARIQSLDDLQPDPFNANRGTDRGRADLRDDHVNVPTAPGAGHEEPVFPWSCADFRNHVLRLVRTNVPEIMADLRETGLPRALEANMRKPRTVRRVQQPRHRSRSVSASTSAPLPSEDALQEPRAEGRAIDPAAVERMFDATLSEHIAPGDLEHIWRGQPGPPAERSWPDPAGPWYCTGIDWAQKCDSTVAAVVRCDTTPLQLVAVYHAQRRAWLSMTEKVGALLDEYPGPAGETR